MKQTISAAKNAIREEQQMQLEMKGEIARLRAQQARSTMHGGQRVEDMDLDTLLNDGHPKAKEYKYDLMCNPIK